MVDTDRTPKKKTMSKEDKLWQEVADWNAEVPPGGLVTVTPKKGKSFNALTEAPAEIKKGKAVVLLNTNQRVPLKQLIALSKWPKITTDAK